MHPALSTPATQAKDQIRAWKYKQQTGNVCATKVLTFQVP